MCEERPLYLQVSTCLSSPTSFHQLLSHSQDLLSRYRWSPEWAEVCSHYLASLTENWKFLPDKSVLIESKPLRSVILAGPSFCSVTLSVSYPLPHIEKALSILDKVLPLGYTCHFISYFHQEATCWRYICWNFTESRVKISMLQILSAPGCSPLSYPLPTK